MAKNLVIVESPAKVKTIKKFLGANYEVAASQGHVRDLPKSQLGVDVDNGFEPRYITIRGKGTLLASLRRQVKKADRVYLATDPDREGEAISWHLLYALGLDEEQDSRRVCRITFNEITKNAVKESLKNPRGIDMNLVDAQQARRVLDRIVGYQISPILWQKVKRGLSAGRVQSAALRMIGDRENEINSFIPEEYWTIDADLTAAGMKKPLTARWYGTVRNGAEEKQDIPDSRRAEEICADLREAEFTVREIKKNSRTKKSPLPYTTSTLQQDASSRLNLSTTVTMRIAQQLYEGVDIKGQGTVGLITYLRTDSTRISEEARAAAASYISETFGPEYGEQAENVRAKEGKIQDAHEAIRPTDITRTPDKVKASLSRDQFRLYQLIWKRFTASRMAGAVYETTQARITAQGKKECHVFGASSSQVLFDGFNKIYLTAEDEEMESGNLKGIAEGCRLTVDAIEPQQHFSQPPAHYTEASLVRAMEEKGIGRPSTYAPTIAVILGRHYITKEKKNLYITELGDVVNNMMIEAFPSIVDAGFTAHMENELDEVAGGGRNWHSVIEEFYPGFEEDLTRAQSELSEVKVADEISDEICDKCGRNMVIKYGPHGKFLACPGFPECRNTRPYFEKIGVTCPKCGKDIVIRKTRKGRTYFGCMGNPECDFMVWQRPSGRNCPVCGNVLLIKGRKLVCADESCGYMEDAAAEESERKDGSSPA